MNERIAVPEGGPVPRERHLLPDHRRRQVSVVLMFLLLFSNVFEG